MNFCKIHSKDETSMSLDMHDDKLRFTLLILSNLHLFGGYVKLKNSDQF